MIKKRIVAYIIDVLLYVLIGGTISEIAKMLGRNSDGDYVFIVCLLLSLAMLVFICKDCFGGQSVGKRKVKIQIIGIDGNPISPIKSILRNLSFIIWPIDIIIILLTNTRIIDKILGSKVVADVKYEKINYKKVAITILVLYILLVAIFWFAMNNQNIMMNILYS